MKTAFLLIGAVLFATPTLAFDAPGVIEQLQDAQFQCTGGQNHDGVAVPISVSKSSCEAALKLALQLSENGYCLKNHEWTACQ